jgi:hypothetical protein
MLTSDGYEVMQTDDPVTVLEIVKLGTPALIITNVSLPGITAHKAMNIFELYAPVECSFATCECCVACSVPPFSWASVAA